MDSSFQTSRSVEQTGGGQQEHTGAVTSTTWCGNLDESFSFLNDPQGHAATDTFVQSPVLENQARSQQDVVEGATRVNQGQIGTSSSGRSYTVVYIRRTIVRFWAGTQLFCVMMFG